LTTTYLNKSQIKSGVVISVYNRLTIISAGSKFYSFLQFCNENNNAEFFYRLMQCNALWTR